MIEAHLNKSSGRVTVPEGRCGGQKGSVPKCSRYVRLCWQLG